MVSVNPFNTVDYNESTDLELITSALNGSGNDLERLVKRHQHYIYNVALKMVLNPQDAEDITQEVLIKVVTKLGQYKGKSNFRTWLYRITFNHFLKMKQTKAEQLITTFDDYGESLDTVVDVEMSEEEKLTKRELIKEAQFGCMFGMLLCLNREQRLVFILGDLFEADHTVGSEILGISKANFRKRLERARRDLYQFMQNKCGLINKNNPCRCARKTSGFIKRGWVNPEKLAFNSDYFHALKNTIDQKNDQLKDLLEVEYADLFQSTPFQEKRHSEKLLRTITQNNKIRDTFNLN